MPSAHDDPAEVRDALAALLECLRRGDVAAAALDDVAAVRNNRGLLFLRMGGADAAQREFVAARATWTAIGDRHWAAAAGWNEAMAAARLGDFARVFELHHQIGAADDTT